MKTSTLLICLTVVFCCCNLLVFSQEVNSSKFNPDPPVFFTPKSHDPNFLKSSQLPEKSFYQRKSEWQHIIDSTWGPGDSLPRKLLIFNTYAQTIHDKFDGFISLKLNYDSLYNFYLKQINDSTSKGAFSSIISHFAFALKDLHTWAGDTSVIYTPLNPGIPILLMGSFLSVEHFGAVTTMLPDSTTLVLRAVPNHPLHLEPGDIILGYEGVPWKVLVKELFDSGIPLMSSAGGCNSANTYYNLMGVGVNWHLFSSIDILKYATGDTLHLSVQPLANLNLPKMRNNEQLAIPNIPFPQIRVDFPEVADTVVTYGILDNTNIGYIFLAMEWSEYNANTQFYDAIKALKNTDALIIDMRLNFGGWALFDKAFNILFNEFNKTIEDSYRCNTNTFELCPSGNFATYQIAGSDPDYFDRPIAVLLGPTCVSMGDLTAHRLRYHPMVRFFGASSAGAFGDNSTIKEFPNWEFHYSYSDMFHTSEPGVYLNRKEFPIDYPVWFNKDDVAKGIDPIVEKSLDWINNLAYGHSVTTDKIAYSFPNDSVKIKAILENPNSHQLSAKLLFDRVNGSVVDSTDMFPVDLTRNHLWEGKWIIKNLPEDMYWISLKVTDNTNGTNFTNKHVTRITTKLLGLGQITFNQISDHTYRIQPSFKNSGTSNILNLAINLKSKDPSIKSVTPDHTILSYIKPGQTRKTSTFTVLVDTTFTGRFNLSFSVSSEDWPYWEIDTTIDVSTGIKQIELLPLAFGLEQNCPNPFNTTTTINWQLAKTSHVTLKVLDITGRTVATLVNEQRPQGKYETQFNAGTLPKGIYFCQLQAGEFSQTKKMILTE